MQQHDNSGALFKNDRKANDKHADYNGSITVNGVEYWLNAWLKDGKKGKFFSLSVKPKDKNAKADPAPRRERREYDDSEEVPF